MPRWLHLLIQGLAVGGQTLNLYAQFIPPETQKAIFLGLSAVQAAVGVIAHHYNTDGTPQTAAYVAPPSESSF